MQYSKIEDKVNGKDYSIIDKACSGRRNVDATNLARSEEHGRDALLHGRRIMKILLLNRGK
jgi:hypothetical protein